jgi:hypothetical protein
LILGQERNAKKAQSHRKPVATSRSSEAIPVSSVDIHPFRHNPVPEPELKRGMALFFSEDFTE